MSFEDLPDDWPTIPLTDPDHIADVLDIFVALRDRWTGSVLVLVCDDQRRPVQPIIIGDIDRTRPAALLPALRRMAETIAAGNPKATVLCAVARRGPLRPTTTDHRWHRQFEAAFAGPVVLLGVHLITLDGSVPMAPRAEEAA